MAFWIVRVTSSLRLFVFLPPPYPNGIAGDKSEYYLRMKCITRESAGAMSHACVGMSSGSRRAWPRGECAEHPKTLQRVAMASALVAILAALQASAAPAPDAKLKFFEEQVRP